MGVAVRGPTMRLLKLSALISQPASLPMRTAHLGAHHGNMHRGALGQFRRGMAKGAGRARWHGFRAGAPDRYAVGGDAELGVGIRRVK